jgi:hypothetical protein
MDKQGRVTRRDEFIIGGKYSWVKGVRPDPDVIVIEEVPHALPYVVVRINGLRVNLWNWRRRLRPIETI